MLRPYVHCATQFVLFKCSPGRSGFSVQLHSKSPLYTAIPDEGSWEVVHLNSLKNIKEIGQNSIALCMCNHLVLHGKERICKVDRHGWL